MPTDPAQLRILHYPAPSLRARAAPVKEITGEVRAVAQRMIDLMREAKGVGLAAPQVGLAWRMFVTEIPGAPGPAVHVNPVVTPVGGERVVNEEGCLSLPGIYVEIDRPSAVTITSLDLDGNQRTLGGDDFAARVWQHEFDHLNGVLIIDKMSPIDRLATRKAIKELEREKSYE